MADILGTIGSVAESVSSVSRMARGGGMGGGMHGAGGFGMGGGGMQGGMALNQQVQRTDDLWGGYDLDRWSIAEENEARAEQSAAGGKAEVGGESAIAAVKRSWEAKGGRSRRALRAERKAAEKSVKAEKKQDAEEAERLKTREELSAGQAGPDGQKAKAVSASDEESRIKASGNDKRQPAPQAGTLRAGLPPLSDFMNANPLNSAILAVDTLSMGPMVLNQVSERYGLSGRSVYGKVSGSGAAEACRGAAGEADGADTPYMESFRRAKAEKLYDVRIRE